jgi:hypothetical protein
MFFVETESIILLFQPHDRGGQLDLDGCLMRYNEERTHQGNRRQAARRCKPPAGRTIAQEKRIA